MDEHQDRSTLKDILRTIPLFKNLTGEDLDFIAARLQEEHYDKGELVFQEGDAGSSMYLVGSGQVRVVRDYGLTEAEEVAVMGPGNFVGDIALILGGTRTATLEVLIDARLWVLQRRDFDALIDSRPAVALEMMRELSRRLVTTTQRKQRRTQRRITALTGGDRGLALSQAIHAQLQSPVGLMPLPAAQMTGEATITAGVMFLDGRNLTEASLAEQLSHQVEVFKHIILLLPEEHNPLVDKAARLADTVVSIGQPPGWLSELEETVDYWVIGESQADLLRAARRLTNRTVGLALSSGGARGLAHIGVLRVLAEENIPIDMIAGSSAGALFGGLYAVGWSYERILAYIRDLKSLTRLPNWDFKIPPLTGIVKGRKARDKFLAEPLQHQTFADLKIPLYIVAADILTGEEVIFDSGSLADAIRASVSIPVLPEPWFHQGHYLVDGGLVNPLPASVLRQRGADIVIASSVIQPLNQLDPQPAADNRPHILQTISNIFSVMEAEIIKKQLSEVDFLIHHNVTARHTFDFDHAEDLIRYGEETARQTVPLIRQFLETPPEQD